MQDGGKPLATGEARLRASEAGARIAALPRPEPAQTRSVGYRPNGQVFFTGVSDPIERWSEIHLRDATPRQWLRTRTPHRGYLSAAFRPDGRTILTAGNDRAARRWDVATGQPVGPALPHPAEVRCVAFSPDARHIATGCRDGAVRLWDAATGR